MVTIEELASLESIVIRARASAGIERAAGFETIHVGDVVQLRPGAERHWGTSIVLVEQLRDNGDIRGTILRPHRSGCQEAWYTFTPPELIRLGRMPYPPPCRAIREQSYLAWCPKCMGRGGETEK